MKAILTGGDIMTERQELIYKKQHTIILKMALNKLSGIDVLEIFENDENIELNNMLLAYRPVMCSPYTKPHSKISCYAKEDDVISWIIRDMGLRENTIYFLLCKGTWVKIKIFNLYDAVKSLWEEEYRNFLLSDAELTHIMEVSSDSRDEENYLLDIWEYTK